MLTHAVDRLILPLLPNAPFERISFGRVPAQFCSVTFLFPLVCASSYPRDHVLDVWVCVSPTGFVLDFRHRIFPMV